MCIVIEKYVLLLCVWKPTFVNTYVHDQTYNSKPYAGKYF